MHRYYPKELSSMTYAKVFQWGVSATPANYPAYGRFLEQSEYVKDVMLLMSSKEDQDKSPTDTTSADPVAPRWSLAGWLDESQSPDYTNTKCSECKVPTLHEWIKVMPTPQFKTEDMILVVSKSRRLTMCTVCGLVKTIT